MSDKKSDGDALENNRTIFFSGDVDDENSKNFITKLIKMEISDPTKDIVLIIDSCGGLVHSFLAILI